MSFFAFAVKGSLVKLHITTEQNTIRRNFIASFQNNCVAHNDIVNVNFYRLAVTPHLTANTAGFLLQFLKGVFVAVLRIGGDQCRQKNCQENSAGFNPVTVPHENEDYVYKKSKE